MDLDPGGSKRAAEISLESLQKQAADSESAAEPTPAVPPGGFDALVLSKEEMLQSFQF